MTTPHVSSQDFVGVQLQRHSTELGDTMRGVFSSVFVHRYRDVRPEIRALCLTELGVWMMEYRSVTILVDWGSMYLFCTSSQGPLSGRQLPKVCWVVFVRQGRSLVARHSYCRRSLCLLKGGRSETGQCSSA